MTTKAERKRPLEEGLSSFPAFFEPALEAPAVLENLCQQARSASIDNPFSAIFKARLATLLARFYSHSGWLRWHVANLINHGMTGEEVLALLQTPVPPLPEPDHAPDYSSDPVRALQPVPNSVFENLLITGATALILESPELDKARTQMRKALGELPYEHLCAFVAFQQTCRLWEEAHPETSLEPVSQTKLEKLQAQEPLLEPFLENYQVSPVFNRPTWKRMEALSADHSSAQKRIRESERLYRLMVEGAYDFAMILLDKDGKIENWNSGAENLLGYAEKDVLGQSIRVIFTAEDRANGVPELELSKATTERKALDVRWHRRQDGTLFWADGIMQALYDENETQQGFAKIVRDATERKRYEEELERFAARGHNISTQLQNALQPELPARVEGLRIFNHYLAAWDEAEVGGDFFDVFALSPTRTALVVGDLCGKGLDAAVQVATVRNMLRAYLYSKPTLVEAITELNVVLTDQQLVTGFSTLFVGIFDASDRQLHYINAGQEPALVRSRGSNQAGELWPTGPAVGMFADKTYEQKSLQLLEGDIVAIFTDGLTEVGPDRLHMINFEGVKSLLLEQTFSNDLNPEQYGRAYLDALVMGVDRYAQGGVRDDVCVLLAVVT